MLVRITRVLALALVVASCGGEDETQLFPPVLTDGSADATVDRSSAGGGGLGTGGSAGSDASAGGSAGSDASAGGSAGSDASAGGSAGSDASAGGSAGSDATVDVSVDTVAQEAAAEASIDAVAEEASVDADAQEASVDAEPPDADPCDGGLAFCSGSCVDTSSDDSHCSACNAPCSGGKHCVGSACVCTGGLQDCSGTCTDTTTTTNCGSCGNACYNGDVCSVGQCCGVLVTPIARAGNYVLEFSDLYFEVSPAGGKIVTFRRRSGSNVLTTSAVNNVNFGATLWTSPQSAWNWWPPPAELDSGPYTTTLSGASITMTSSAATGSGPHVIFTKTFTANTCAHAIDIDYAITNPNGPTVSLAPWEVSRALPSGLALFPKGTGTPTGGLKVGPLADGGAYQIDDVGGYYWFDHAAHPLAGQKLLADGALGWIAWTNGADLFVKKWTDVPPASQAPAEAEVELYDGTGYVELETQGPYEAYAAGETKHWAMRWYLQAISGHRTVGDSTLIAAVNGIVK